MNTRKSSLTRLGLVSLISTSLALLSGCNATKESNLKVAGGDADVGGLYSSTVYVEMIGQDFNGQPKPPVRNVGTFVQIPELPGYRVLILSLSDVLVANGSKSQIPLFKEIDLKIHGADGKSSVSLPRLDFDSNTCGLKASGSAQIDYITAFGFDVEKIGPSDIPADMLNKCKGRLFSRGSVPEKFLNGRTSFLMLALHEEEVAKLGIGKSPLLTPAESRGTSSGKLVMVGFGERDAKSHDDAIKDQKKDGFALSDELPNINVRNFAEVSGLTGTPFSKINNGANSNVMWEVSGSGLCGKNKDGSENYDTGAGVYSSPDSLVGFAIRSTSMPKFEGTLDCAATAREQMATLIVSPSSADIASLKANIAAGGSK